tara:strand:+ start:372 stop:536 length:165 start_codon:yes stop_codon:yes gene_type:complete
MLSFKFLKIIEYIKIIKLEIKEDKEEYLEKYKTINQVRRKRTPKLIEKEKSIPK